MLKMLVDDVMGDLIPATSDSDGVFAAFRDVLAADATVIRLHDMLAKGYAACRTNHTKAAAKLHAVINVIYASILTLAASRRLYKLVAQRRARSTGRMPEERWGIVFASVALDVLLILVGPTDLSRALSWRTLRYLRHEAVDPNVGRRLLIDRVVATGGA